MRNTHYSCCAHAHPAHSWVGYCRDDNCTAAFIAFGVAMVYMHAYTYMYMYIYAAYIVP